MVFRLILLCRLLQRDDAHRAKPHGRSRRRQLATELEHSPGKGGHVLIAVRPQADDALFARQLEQALTAAGVQVTVVTGEPRDAREALQKLAAKNTPLDAIAGNRVTASWLVFADLPTDFPALGHPRLVKPRSYRWPNFLKSENLLNIANQIAVIAIIAIGMTMVIITAGIDLSVGSLLAFRRCSPRVSFATTRAPRTPRPWA